MRNQKSYFFFDHPLSKINQFSLDQNYEDTRYNQIPTLQEITDIIKKKGNNKSTPDVKNEMLKRPGEIMAKFLYPLIVTIWTNEVTPGIWNMGTITFIFKGKGDKEVLSNHRGIGVFRISQKCKKRLCRKFGHIMRFV